MQLNELPGEVNPSQTPLSAFAAWVNVLKSRLSVKLKEVSRERMHHDAFLSHAGADKPAVERLATKLREGVEAVARVAGPHASVLLTDVEQ